MEKLEKKRVGKGTSTFGFVLDIILWSIILWSIDT